MENGKIRPLADPCRWNPKVNVGLRVAKFFSEWLQFYIRYGDAAISNAKIDAKKRCFNSVHVGGWLQAETLHSKLRPNRCNWGHGYYWQPIGTRHRSIQLHHCRHPTTYGLTTVHALQADDRRRHRPHFVPKAKTFCGKSCIAWR